MEDIKTIITDIQSQLKVIVAQMNAQNVQLEEMKNSLAAKDHKLEEQTKLIRDMLVKQDMVCIDTLTVQKGTISSGSSTTSKTKAKAKVAAEDTGEFSDIKFTNIREFFKSLFVHNREILKVRDNDDEFKETYGIDQNGFLTEEIIDAMYQKEKEGIEKKKTQELKDKALGNKLYADLVKEDKGIIECMKGQLFAFKETRKIINLQADNEEPDVDATEDPRDDNLVAVPPGDDDEE
jgi:mRNA-degrading endonuclease YafQ of YafQ-DinJ toxin-antitoxin module